VQGGRTFAPRDLNRPASRIASCSVLAIGLRRGVY
jgi:hypothetical protein